jgi:hypothetical protein
MQGMGSRIVGCWVVSRSLPAASKTRVAPNHTTQRSREIDSLEAKNPPKRRLGGLLSKVKTLY